MTVRALSALDVEAMAHIHAASFDRPWPALDMAVHIEKDHCLGLGSPLTSFIILRGTDLHCEILTIATHPDHRGQGYGHQLLSSAVQILASEGNRNYSSKSQKIMMSRVAFISHSVLSQSDVDRVIINVRRDGWRPSLIRCAYNRN